VSNYCVNGCPHWLTSRFIAAYFVWKTVNELQSVSDIPELQNLAVPHGTFVAVRARDPARRAARRLAKGAAMRPLLTTSMVPIAGPSTAGQDLHSPNSSAEDLVHVSPGEPSKPTYSSNDSSPDQLFFPGAHVSRQFPFPQQAFQSDPRRAGSSSTPHDIRTPRLRESLPVTPQLSMAPRTIDRSSIFSIAPTTGTSPHGRRLAPLKVLEDTPPYRRWPMDELQLRALERQR
jgi:hypothetical protein